MKKSPQLVAIGIGFLATTVLLTGCTQDTTVKPTPTVSSTSTPTSAPVTYPELASEAYEEIQVPADLAVSLPMAPQELYNEGEEIAASAPTVNIPELENWVTAQETSGWTLQSKSNEGGLYSVQLSKDGRTMFVDAVLSEDDPFTSVLVSASEDE